MNNVIMENQKRKEYKTFIGMNLPISYVERIEDFRNRYRIRGKAEAYEQLIDLGLYVESKIGLVQSIPNEELETLKEQINMGQVVDYVMEMDQRKFSLIMDIMKNEEKSRLTKKGKK